ncbi:3-ketoacyl-ACP reductase [Lacihabitans sp. LS3-19]|uniref:3-ketoacyl-ACP reductase n=1 Tax=Lacihabitans sp. LS3-19 TaxID=2487335 RepID=UPI0020CE59D1|nr:3-ketoacyl-ACP reductase [Lacihabitans sp. LS3-19]MCP9769455.1 3-ketoacyl-ACP reductase [Lacihabitans sp. LS3-19]
MKKVALITGGTRGIGLGIAQKMAIGGFDLAINGMRSENDVESVLADLKELGADVIYCQGDISKKEDREAVLEKIKTNFSKLNVLVNNAGIAPKERRDLLEMSEESFENIINTNLKGPFFLSQSVANWMLEQKQKDASFEGSIINVSSISATVASINRGEYCISKAGVAMATQLFAVRMAEVGIPVFEVRPGIIKTDMTEKVSQKYDDLIEDGLCLTKRWGLPEDVGKAVAAIAQGNFLYSTGQVFLVDGGLTVARL